MQHWVAGSAHFRANTEDRALVANVGRATIACIADGTGGMSGGALAAELFVAGVRRTAERSTFDVTSTSAWVDLVNALDHEISRHPRAGETTGVALAITPSTLVGASSGDSQAWLENANGWHQLTEQQLSKPRLGTGCAGARSFAIQPHGTLLLATDGLFDYVQFDDIAKVLSSDAADPAAALVQLVVSRFPQLPDDVAVIVGKLP